MWHASLSSLRGPVPPYASECMNGCMGQRLHSGRREPEANVCMYVEKRGRLPSSYPNLMPLCISGQLNHLRMKLTYSFRGRKKGGVGAMPFLRVKGKWYIRSSMGDRYQQCVGLDTCTSQQPHELQRPWVSVWGAGWEQFVAGILLRSTNISNISFFLFFLKRKEKIKSARAVLFFCSVCLLCCFCCEPNVYLKGWIFAFNILFHEIIFVSD